MVGARFSPSVTVLRSGVSRAFGELVDDVRTGVPRPPFGSDGARVATGREQQIAARERLAGRRRRAVRLQRCNLCGGCRGCEEDVAGRQGHAGRQRSGSQKRRDRLADLDGRYIPLESQPPASNDKLGRREMRALRDEIQHLTLIAGKLAEARAVAAPTTTRGSVGADLFESVVDAANSMSRYLATDERFPVNAAGTATLARAVLEACEVFHYHYLDECSDEERRLRRAVRHLHEHREEAELRALFGVGAFDKGMNAFGISGYFGAKDARENGVFVKLSSGTQRDIMLGKRERSPALPPKGSPIGMTETEWRAAYKLLSNAATLRRSALARVELLVRPAWMSNFLFVLHCW